MLSKLFQFVVLRFAYGDATRWRQPAAGKTLWKIRPFAFNAQCHAAFPANQLRPINRQITYAQLRHIVATSSAKKKKSHHMLRLTR